MISANAVVSVAVAKERSDGCIQADLRDIVHWLKVAMRQAQSDIKSNKGKILELENQVVQLKKDLEDIKNNT